MDDYPRAVYEYLRTLGDIGDVVPTAIHPYLMKTFDLAPLEARKARAKAMADLQSRHVVERLNTRGCYVKILAEYYPDPWMSPQGKFVEHELKLITPEGNAGKGHSLRRPSPTSVATGHDLRSPPSERSDRPGHARSGRGSGDFDDVFLDLSSGRPVHGLAHE
jgi:hypothetical protein